MIENDIISLGNLLYYHAMKCKKCEIDMNLEFLRMCPVAMNINSRIARLIESQYE